MGRIIPPKVGEYYPRRQACLGAVSRGWDCLGGCCCCNCNHGNRDRCERRYPHRVRAGWCDVLDSRSLQKQTTNGEASESSRNKIDHEQRKKRPITHCLYNHEAGRLITSLDSRHCPSLPLIPSPSDPATIRPIEPLRHGGHCHRHGQCNSSPAVGPVGGETTKSATNAQLMPRLSGSISHPASHSTDTGQSVSFSCSVSFPMSPVPPCFPPVPDDLRFPSFEHAKPVMSWFIARPMICFVEVIKNDFLKRKKKFCKRNEQSLRI